MITSLITINRPFSFLQYQDRNKASMRKFQQQQRSLLRYIPRELNRSLLSDSLLQLAFLIHIGYHVNRNEYYRVD